MFAHVTRGRIAVVVSSMAVGLGVTPVSAAVADSTGQPGWFVFQDQPLSGDTVASVDVANGDLMLSEQDLSASDASYEVAYSRYFNSQSAVDTGLGAGWSLDVGPAVYLDDNGPSVTVHGPNGYVVSFPRQADGTFSVPDDFDGTFAQEADGTYTLSRSDEADVYHFDASGQMTDRTNADGLNFTVQTTSAAGHTVLGSYGNTSGRRVNFSFNGQAHLIEADDPASTHRYYGYTSGRLTSYTAPSGDVTHYAYTSGKLTSITLADATSETFAYSANKITSVTVSRSGQAAEGETFSYQAPTAPCDPSSDAGETVVTSVPDDGASQTFCHDASGRITDYSGGPDFDDVDITDGVQGGLDDNSTCSNDPNPAVPPYCGQDDEPEGSSSPSMQSFSQPAAPGDLSAHEYGISDNNGLGSFNIFANPSFQKLHTVIVRRVVPWNVAEDASARADLENWVNDVRALKGGGDISIGEPLISFNRCEGTFARSDPNDVDNGQQLACGGANGYPPTLTEYTNAMNAFFADPVLAEVKDFTAWNEPNLGSATNPYEPTWNQPATAAKYWQILDYLCRSASAGGHGCRVAAGDFSDITMNDAYAPSSSGGAYFNAYQAALGHKLTVYRWAWHTYEDTKNTYAKKADPSGWWPRLKNFKAATQEVTPGSSVWLTENGVVLSQRNKTMAAGRSQAIADFEMKALVDDGAHQATRQSARIDRFLYYEMLGEPLASGHQDSGLLRVGGSHAPRPQYTIYRRKTT